MPPKILIVDDEPSIVEPVVYALGSAGYEARHETTLGGARAALAEDDFDLLILDVGLPDGNGLDFCRELRQDSAIPVVFLTARDGEIDRILGLELGGDDYVTKPFSPRELVARVKAVLRRMRSPEIAATTAFAIDEATHTARFHGQVLALTRYEFRLLAVLTGHPERVFSREDLMRRVWEGYGCSMERTVDTHVKTIRAKLRAIRPDDDSIVTHRGVGYALRAQ